MLSWLDYAAGVEGIAAALLGLFLALRGIRKPATWILSLLILDFAVQALVVEIPRYLVETKALPGPEIPPEAQLAWFVARSLMISLNLAFAVVFPVLTLDPRKKILLLAAFIPGVLLAVTMLADPALVVDPKNQVTFMGRLVAFLLLASPVPALWVFGDHWVRFEAGPYRTQFLYVLIPYLFWNLNSGVSFFFRTLVNPERIGLALYVPTLLLSLGIIGLVARIGIHAYRRATTPEFASEATSSAPRVNVDQRLVFWILAGIPIAFLQFLGTGGRNFVDGLAIPLLFYGMARYQVLEIDLALRTGVRRGVVGSAMVFVLVGVEQVIQTFAAAPFGFSVGLGAAIVVGLLFAPLHRAADRVGDKLFPRAAKKEAYLRERRMELYRVALEGVLQDRQLDPRETRALSALRTRLAVTLQEHDLLEAELRSTRQKKFRRAYVVSAG